MSAQSFDALADAAAPAIMDLAAYCVGRGKQLADLVFIVTREGEHHDSPAPVTRRAPGAVVSAALRASMLRADASEGLRVELAAAPPAGCAKCILHLRHGGRLDRLVADVAVAS